MQSMIHNLLVVFSFVIYSVSYSVSNNICVQTIPGCTGTESECSRSIVCSHGNCVQNEVCKCDHCWHGDSCNQYVDARPPVFANVIKEVIVFPSDTDILTAFAEDQDLWTTCEGSLPCPCADITYSIRSGNKGSVFTMDQVTGKLTKSKGSSLKLGAQYSLVLVASSVNISSSSAAVVEIVVRVENEPTQLSQPIPEPLKTYPDEKSFSRPKRAGSKSSTSADTQLNLTQVTAADSVHPGDRVNFQFQIVLPPAISMDMTVEMFTFDPESSKTAFMLCHPIISYVGDGVQSSENANISALLPDISGALIDDRAVFDLGMLEVADTTDANARTMIIDFGVSLLMDSDNVANNLMYRVVAGAEYDNATYVMVGQAQLTANTTTDLSSYSSNFIVDQVDSIAIDDFVILKGHFYTTRPYGDVTVESFSATNNRSISYSIANMRVSSAGPNYCRRYYLMEYNATYFSFTENGPNYRGSLFIPDLANCDGDRSLANETGNEMVVEIAVLVPNDVDIIGEELQLAVTATVDPTTTWTHVVDIPIVARVAQTMKSASLSVLNDTLPIMQNGVAVIVLDVTLEVGSYSNVVIELLAPNEVGAPPTMSACSCILKSKGFNILIQPGFTNIGSSRSGQENVTDRVVANFGRVVNTGQLPSTNTSANKFTVEFAITALSDSIVDPVVINLKNSETDATAIASKQIAVNVQPNSQIGDGLNVTVTISPMMDTNIFIDGSTGMLLKMLLKPGAFFSPVEASFMGPISSEDPVVRVCRAEVIKVGPGLPCVNSSAINGDVKYMEMYEDSQLNNLAVASVGTLCATSNEMDEAEILFSIALQLPRQSKVRNSKGVMFSAGIMVGNSYLWTGNFNLTARTGVVDQLRENCSSRVDATPPSEYIAPGAAGIIYFRIVIPTKSYANHVLTLTAPTDSKASVCSLNIVQVGHNLPCVDQRPIPGDLSFGNTITVINYVPMVNPKNGNKKAILNFGIIANTGLQEGVPYIESDDNAILIAATVKISENATTNVTFSYSLDIGGLLSAPNQVVVPVSTSVSPNPAVGYFNITASVFDEDDTIYINASKVVVVDFQVPADYSGLVSVKFSSPLSTPVLKICAATITWVGDNVPCLNDSLVMTSYSSITGDPLKCNDTAIIDLGVLCTVPITDDPLHYWVRAEASVNVVDDVAALSLGTLSVDAAVTISDLTFTKTVTLTPTDSLPLIVVNTSLITVQKESNVSIPEVKVGRTVWAAVNFTIAKNTSNAPVVIVVQGPSADGRAIVVVKSLRVAAVGINIGCIPKMPDVRLITSDRLTTNQTDVLVADLGYVTNTGMTYRRGFPMPLDDHIAIEVELMITDHPLATDASEHSVQIMLEVGGDVVNETEVEIPLSVLRDNMERPAIQGIMNIPAPAKIYRTGNIVNLQILLSHAEYSTAEPINTIVRVFLPPYIQLATLVSHNLSSNINETSSGSPFLDIQLSGPFLFGDIYELNLTVTVDPENSRGFEAGITNATIVARAYATMLQRNGYPSDPSKTFSCDGFYTMFEVGGTECFDVLGMQDDRIANYQLMASTATDSSHGPSFARLGLPSGQGWRPNLRLGDNDDYLRVYFGNKTRITRIAIEKDPCCRAVSSAEFSHSDDGLSWTISHKELELNYTGNLALVDIPKPFESRHLKMRIVNCDKPELASTMYINVRIELYGCPVTSDVSATDIDGILPPTMFSDSEQYRHFVVNTHQDAIYVCDVSKISGEHNKLNCFCSADGNLWNSVDETIDRFIGFNSAENVVYGQNSDTGTYFRSSDCNQWFLAESSEVMTANSSGNLIENTNIPAVSSDDPRVSITKGSWSSSFDGLSHNGDQKAIWSNGCIGN